MHGGFAMDEISTMFAPAESADMESVLKDVDLISNSDLAHHISNVIPFTVLILNHHRQVVYKSNKLMQLLGEGSADTENSIDTIIGKRPGEIFDCIHAQESPGGCGTTEFCRECGAVRVILESQKSDKIFQDECRINTKSGSAYDFRVWASKYEFKDKQFTIFSILDIGDEKRRSALERTFFHDINNTVTSISNYTGLLKKSHKFEKFPKYAGVMQHACKRLMDEINSHRKLSAAENGDLAVDVSVLNSLELIKGIVKTTVYNTGIQTSHILIDEDAQDFSFDSDRSLIFRIITNMLKNAVEASIEYQKVVVSCMKDEGRAIFSVHNTGYMERSIQLQVFERSFSTKGSGRGIGTYSMKLFGEKYLKGKVWFESDKCKGTTFYISIPLR